MMNTNLVSSLDNPHSSFYITIHSVSNSCYSCWCFWCYCSCCWWNVSLNICSFQAHTIPKYGVHQSSDVPILVIVGAYALRVVTYIDNNTATCWSCFKWTTFARPTWAHFWMRIWCFFSRLVLIFNDFCNKETQIYIFWWYFFFNSKTNICIWYAIICCWYPIVCRRFGTPVFSILMINGLQVMVVLVVGNLSCMMMAELLDWLERLSLGCIMMDEQE